MSATTKTSTFGTIVGDITATMPYAVKALLALLSGGCLGAVDMSLVVLVNWATGNEWNTFDKSVLRVEWACTLFAMIFGQIEVSRSLAEHPTRGNATGAVLIFRSAVVITFFSMIGAILVTAFICAARRVFDIRVCRLCWFFGVSNTIDKFDAHLMMRLHIWPFVTGFWHLGA